ncbi:MAG TPA: HEAT repeat domain-containing protein [Blastocatellia bacterium]|nr:HEAT repeat domain-containing protein [Blastocatellia bacterium]
MKLRIRLRLGLAAGLLACGVLGPAGAGAQTVPMEPPPLYQQCPALTTDGAIPEQVEHAIASLKESNSQTRAESALKLGDACDKRAVEPLAELLRDPERPVRLAAIEALGKLGDPDSVPRLNEIIDDEDWQIRLALVRSLASFKTFRPRNLVVNGIANPNNLDPSDVNDVRVRCIAILTANQLTDVQHSRKSILFLHRFLGSRYESTRRLAEQAMFALKQTRNGSTELIAILKLSNHSDLRSWSAIWIGKLGIENGRETLNEVAAHDPNPKVKEAAAEALKALDIAKKS